MGEKVKTCIGCGFCCMQAPCSGSVRLYGDSYPCPALTWSELDQRHYCKLCQIPGPLGECYRKEFYIGAGCCSGLNSWREEPLQNRVFIHQRQKELQSSIDPYFQVFLTCLGSPFTMTNDSLALLILQFQYRLIKHGISEDEIDRIIAQVTNYIYNNKNNTFRDFTG
jgi:hypothetical protein